VAKRTFGGVGGRAVGRTGPSATRRRRRIAHNAVRRGLTAAGGRCNTALITLPSPTAFSSDAEGIERAIPVALLSLRTGGAARRAGDAAHVNLCNAGITITLTIIHSQCDAETAGLTVSMFGRQSCGIGAIPKTPAITE